VNNDPTTQPNDTRAYAEKARQLDHRLDSDLRDLRDRQDRGQITVRQASDLRVAILSEHLAEISRLRVEHFGEADPATGWQSGTAGAS
jgi:hypothetical protein